MEKKDLVEFSERKIFDIFGRRLKISDCAVIFYEYGYHFPSKIDKRSHKNAKFVCGEWAHENFNSSLHGAMETAERVVDEVIRTEINRLKYGRKEAYFPNSLSAVSVDNEMHVIAMEEIKKGQLLLSWGGAMVNEESLQKLDKTSIKRSVQIDDDAYLAPDIPDDPPDFINHSCSPNAGIRGYADLVALKDIKPGERICYDYAMTDTSSYDEFKCLCGHDECRGSITGQDWKIAKIQEKYFEYFSDYIKDKIIKTASLR